MPGYVPSSGSAPRLDLVRTELPALTSVRALLAWWVVAFHVLPVAPFGFNRRAPLLSKGMLAVDCFFLLSGFILCHVHPRILDAPRRAPVADFLVSRLARIYPLHAAMLAAFGANVVAYRLLRSHGHAFADDTLPALLRQVLLVHGWLPSNDFRSWNVPSWSISSEWAAYLLAPLIFFAITRASRHALLLLLALGGGLAVWLLETGRMGHADLKIPRVVLEFTLGATMRALVPFVLPFLLRIRNPGLVVGWLACAVAAASPHPGLLLLGMSWVLLLLSLRSERTTGRLARLERVTIYLGETSFAVYMCHALVLMLWSGHQPRFLAHAPAAELVVAALTLMLVIQLLASLLHHTVERPAQRWIRQRFRHWREPRGAEVVEGRAVTAA